jgi:caa(3)-type oxidase subunit IV
MKTNLQSKKAIIIVWGGLVLLLLLIIASSFVENSSVRAALILTLPLAQMLLVAVFFMHLCVSPKLYWAFAAAGLFWLTSLFTLVACDYLTRRWH